MKILILLRWFPFLGGTESISVSLANQLAEGDADIFIFGQKLPGVNVDFELAEGVSVVTVDEPLSPENTCRVIRRLNIDYVLFQCPFPAQLAIAEAIVKLTDARLFVTVHDDPLHAMAAQWPVKANSSRLSLVVKRMAWPLYRLWADNRGKHVMSRYIRSADRLILLSPAYERALCEALDLPEECRRKLISIPNFLPESAFPQKTAAKRKEMVYVGRVVELQKRLSRLVRNWKMFEERHDDWKLRIVGDGEDLDSLKRYAAKLGVGSISFEGYSSDVRSFLKPASVVLLVSDSEGLPMSLIEAMAEGCIPVCYDSFAALKDIIENGKEGFAIPSPASATGLSVAAREKESAQLMVEALCRLAEDPDLMERMREAAAMKARDFSSSAVMPKWFSLLG